jgi:hypothetical protein
MGFNSMLWMVVVWLLVVVVAVFPFPWWCDIRQLRADRRHVPL